MASAAPTPMTFCITSMPTTQAVKRTSATPAAREHARVGAEADGGEEREHQPGLQRRVEAQVNAREVQHGHQQRGQQTADDGFRDRVLAEERDALDQSAADDQHERGARERRGNSELPVHDQIFAHSGTM